MHFKIPTLCNSEWLKEYLHSCTNQSNWQNTIKSTTTKIIKYPCNTQYLKILLPCISNNFYPKRPPNSNNKLNLQQNTICTFCKNIIILAITFQAWFCWKYNGDRVAKRWGLSSINPEIFPASPSPLSKQFSQTNLLFLPLCLEDDYPQLNCLETKRLVEQPWLDRVC